MMGGGGVVSVRNVGVKRPTPPNLLKLGGLLAVVAHHLHVRHKLSLLGVAHGVDPRNATGCSAPVDVWRGVVVQVAVVRHPHPVSELVRVLGYGYTHTQ